MSRRLVLVGVAVVALAAVAGAVGYRSYRQTLPEVRIVWDQSGPVGTTGTVVNLTPKQFQHLKVSLAAPLPVSHRGFTVGESADRIYVSWGERVISETNNVKQADGGIMSTRQTEFIQETQLPPQASTPFRIDAEHLTYPVAGLQVADGARALRVEQVLPQEPKGP